MKNKENTANTEDTENTEDINIETIIQIKNEIETLLKEINEKENYIIEKVRNNFDNISVYRMYLENIIEEYHTICKKIYK
jgi:hypothetical protein